jgi:ferredoxin-type protein NapF
MDPRRRFFLRGSLQRATAPQAPRPPRPPWALADEADFTARCTRCDDCRRACPRELLHEGDGGFPEIRFTRQGCDACGACSRACATGAIGPVSGEAFAWRVAVAPHCLALRQVECRACGDACDTGALRFRPAPGGIRRLAVDTARCTGCGDCLPPCPVGALVLGTPAPG